MDKEYYSIDNLNEDILSLISQVRSANLKIDVILSVNRGGCIPGVYLSHGLKLPHKVIDLQLRDGTNIPDSNSVKNLKINSKKILIIDDINDTGSTFIHLNRIINANNTKKYFACLINNIGSKFQVEFYGRSINKVEKPSWYVFPWEIES
ncbi:MAG: phosphoribosyltransferase [Bacteroidota bacterium]|nr:phosphoribosyltransferase [Bacteroidota bacterium]MEC8615154.1 phosphoribosyltransferase [Bacteroidota bacterium]|tara:strand:- start:627 stop:1076 length:450 start_codon:yes stop_codon:yes gene_type:complete